MTTAPEFTITRTFAAPRELVWRAWTDEKELAGWLHPNGVTTPAESISCDVREGGRFRYTMVDDETGTEYPAGGRFIEVVPPERLVFTWSQPEAPDDESPVATVVLAAENDQTEMIFHLRGVVGRPGDDGVHDGWDEALTNLAEYLVDSR